MNGTALAGRDTGGFTLIEMLIAAVIGIAIVGAMVPVFAGSQSANDRQDAMRELQGEIQLVSEFLVRAVRTASQVHVDSRSDLLVLEGSEVALGCQVAEVGDPMWVAVLDDGLRCGAHDGSGSQGRLVAGSVTQLTLGYGIDSEGDGVVLGSPGEYPADFDDEDAPDILGVGFLVSMERASARSEFTEVLRFTAALRAPLMLRATLAD